VNAVQKHTKMRENMAPEGFFDWSEGLPAKQAQLCRQNFEEIPSPKITFSTGPLNSGKGELVFKVLDIRTFETGW